MNQQAAAVGQTEIFTLKETVTRHVAAWGLWTGSPTAKLQVSVGGATERWFDVANASFTADGIARIELPAGRYRWDVAGGTPNLNLHVSEV